MSFSWSGIFGVSLAVHFPPPKVAGVVFDDDAAFGGGVGTTGACTTRLATRVRTPTLTSCFRCGDDDHLSYDCPQATPPRSAPPAIGPSGTAGPGPTPHPPVPAWREPDPPSAEYIETRRQLGHHSGGEFLMVRCPWCDSGVYQACINRATGQVTGVHQARRAFATETVSKGN
jgi:hypothetical protein